MFGFSKAHQYLIGLLSVFILLPASFSFACGGLFCDTTTPVNQAAERILFAPDPDEDLMHMHVLIQYEGPAEQFGWLLPVPPGTSFGLSRQALFSELDSRYQPTFRLNRIRAEYCSNSSRGGILFSADSSAEDGGTSMEPAVQVTSQSQVGPYDQVTLNAESVSALVEWLDENNYQVPDNAEETLTPYIGDYEFLAIKLSSGQESGDIQPVSLTFSGELATIPMRPTAVAAEDDMGVIVHLLGSARGIPSNYEMVELNLAALDWFNPANHYAQLVSHAVDESENGQAFVTDFAGDHNFPAESIVPIISTNLVLAMEEARDSVTMYEVLVRLFEGPFQPDLNSFLVSALPFEREVNQLLIDLAQRQQPSSDIEVSGLLLDEEEMPLEVDGAAVANVLTAYNLGGQSLTRLFNINSYLTRLYTTLSASEMSVDPSFQYNADLADVPNNRVADLYLNCDGSSDYIVTPDGLEVDLSGEEQELIERQNGQTVRGTDTIGAAVILRPMSAGQPEVISDQRETLKEIYHVKRPDKGLFGCQQSSTNVSWFNLNLHYQVYSSS